jgi:hypothetical protein
MSYIPNEDFPVSGSLDPKWPEPRDQIRSTARSHDRVTAEDELSQDASSVGAFWEAEIPGFLDFIGLNEPAGLNLVPSVSLPRRAWHKNEQAHASRH